MLLQATMMLVMRRLVIEIEHLRDEAELIVIPPPCPLDVQSADFSRADELIESSYNVSATYLDSAAERGTATTLSTPLHGRDGAGQLIETARRKRV